MILWEWECENEKEKLLRFWTFDFVFNQNEAIFNVKLKCTKAQLVTYYIYIYIYIYGGVLCSFFYHKTTHCTVRLPHFVDGFDRFGCSYFACDIIYYSVAILGIKNINRMPQIQPQEITQFSLIDKTIQFTAK